MRNFRGSTGKIYGFVKSNSARGVFATKPKNLMVEKDLYALLGESGPARQAVEEGFSRFEAGMKPVADKIITAARSNAPPRLTPEERAICHLFHYGMFVRTPDISAEMEEDMDPLDNDAFIECYANENNLNAHDMEVALNFLRNSDNQKVMDHDAHVRAVASPPPSDVVKKLAASGLKIAHISKANKSFVIGSYALALAKYQGENHAWLPISHDVAVEPSRYPWKEDLVELTQDYHIRAINEASFRRSRIVAAGSAQLLRSLAKRFGCIPSKSERPSH